MGNNAVTWSEHVLSKNKKGESRQAIKVKGGGKFFVTVLFIKCSKQ